MRKIIKINAKNFFTKIQKFWRTPLNLRKIRSIHPKVVAKLFI